MGVFHSSLAHEAVTLAKKIQHLQEKAQEAKTYQRKTRYENKELDRIEDYGTKAWNFRDYLYSMGETVSGKLLRMGSQWCNV